jgi:hypothetical protein
MKSSAIFLNNFIAEGTRVKPEVMLQSNDELVFG